MGLPLSVARGITAPGGRWREADWLLAQAWSDLERHTCSGCGTPLAQALDPKLERKWRAEAPIRCHPCTVRANAERPYREHQAKDPSYVADALRFPVTLAE